jgi:hypothetical protein
VLKSPLHSNAAGKRIEGRAGNEGCVPETGAFGASVLGRVAMRRNLEAVGLSAQPKAPQKNSKRKKFANARNFLALIRSPDFGDVFLTPLSFARNASVVLVTAGLTVTTPSTNPRNPFVPTETVSTWVRPVAFSSSSSVPVLHLSGKRVTQELGRDLGRELIVSLLFERQSG